LLVKAPIRERLMAAESPRFFFSYAREDSEFVLRLARELREAGANVWLDQLDIRGGSRWDDSIQAALESCRGLVAVLSPSSVASQNFRDEVSYALEEQRPVIPLLYRECAIPFRLRRLQYVNLTINYDDGFAELLRSMGLERPTESAVPPVVAPALNEATVGEEAKRKAEPETRREADQSRDQEKVDKAERREEPRQLPAPVAATGLKALPPRKAGALVGGVAGGILGVLSCLLLGDESDRSLWLLGAFFSGIPCAIAGAITGTNRKFIKAALAAALVGAVIVAFREQKEKLLAALMEGLPLGALSGAIAILLWSKARSISQRFKKGE
jgi:hypothetical protein